MKNTDVVQYDQVIYWQVGMYSVVETQQFRGDLSQILDPYRIGDKVVLARCRNNILLSGIRTINN